MLIHMYHRKDEVHNKKFQLDSLDQQLRETEARLKDLETKHKRRSQMFSSGRSPIQEVFSETDESGDSDTYGRSSPSDEGRRK